MKTEIVNFRNEIAKLEAEQKNVKEQRINEVIKELAVDFNEKKSNFNFIDS